MLACFFNFIKKNKEYLSESLLELYRKEFIEEFSRGVEFEVIKKENKNINSYINHTSKETLVVNDFKLLETVTDKMVTRDFVSLENYIVNYNLSEGRTKEIEIIGVNYLQSISIFCTPSITITIYHKSIPSGIPLKPNDLENFYKNNMNRMKADAQALISMCEERYEFSYWRER